MIGFLVDLYEKNFDNVMSMLESIDTRQGQY